MSTVIAQKEIKRLINNGSAIDVTHWNTDCLYKLMHGAAVEKLFYSHGVNGCNGAVIEVNGKMYAVASRCSNMYIIL